MLGYHMLLFFFPDNEVPLHDVQRQECMINYDYNIQLKFNLYPYRRQVRISTLAARCLPIETNNTT